VVIPSEFLGPRNSNWRDISRVVFTVLEEFLSPAHRSSRRTLRLEAATLSNPISATIFDIGQFMFYCAGSVF
jgi:hypothetical protein